MLEENDIVVINGQSHQWGDQVREGDVGIVAFLNPGILRLKVPSRCLNRWVVTPEHVEKLI